MLTMRKNLTITSLLCVAVLFLNGCAAIGTSTKKQDLKLHAKLTQTIFLDPVVQEKRSVYIQLRNSSTSQAFNITQAITDNLASKGYSVTTNPEEATYWLQANIRYVGAPEGKEFADVMSSGGALFEGAIAGAAISSATGGSGSDNAKAAIIMALIGYAADSMINDVYHTAITDIQLSERIDGTVSTESTHDLQQGESGSGNQQIATISDRKKYQTRVMVTANQMNMDISQGELAMQDKLATIISGLF